MIDPVNRGVYLSQSLCYIYSGKLGRQRNRSSICSFIHPEIMGSEIADSYQLIKIYIFQDDIKSVVQHAKMPISKIR